MYDHVIHVEEKVDLKRLRFYWVEVYIVLLCTMKSQWLDLDDIDLIFKLTFL